MRIAIPLMTLACCLPTLSFSQHTIFGRLTDGKDGLPSANVVLLSVSDSTVTKGLACDADGFFAFRDVNRGSYTIKASILGYADFTSDTFEVGYWDVALSDFVLLEAATELCEVVVTAEKSMVTQYTDRLVVNVQSRITSSGNTILEILQKSPGVIVNRQSNTISMNGRTGVRVLVNGKPLQIPADALMQMLDGLNASGVEKLELIGSPSSRYDAEGNAGVINIVTTKREEYGTNGSVGLVAGYRKGETLGLNMNVQHRAERSAWFLDYAVTRTRNRHIMRMSSQWTDSGIRHANENQSCRPNLTHQHNLTGGLELSLSEKLAFNVLISGYRRNWTLAATTDDAVHVDGASSILTTMKVDETNRWQSATGSAGLVVRPDLKRKVELAADYLYYHNDNPSTYRTASLSGQSGDVDKSDILLSKDTPIRMVVGRVDYSWTISSVLSMDVGAKLVHSALRNAVTAQRVKDNTSRIDSAFTSDSRLSEGIEAAYLSTTWKFSKATTINSGLRYEYTHTRIYSAKDEALVDRRFSSLFPNVAVTTALQSGRNAHVSYARRLTRPTYNDIAPFVFFWGPNTFSAGNTGLQPAISDAINLSYQNHGWAVAIHGSRTKGEIINLFQPERDAVNNNVVFRSQNLDYLNMLSVTGTWSFKLTHWWDLDASLTAQYQVVRTKHLADNAAIKLPGASLTASSILQLGKGMSVEISGFVHSTSCYGISKFLPYGTLNAGVQKRMNKAIIRISMDDILYMNVWRIRTLLPDNGLDTYIRYDWHNRFIRLTYSYNFGRQLPKVNLKSGASEERRRVAN